MGKQDIFILLVTDPSKHQAMGRKVKLQWIMNDTARRMYKKRVKGLLIKVKEMSILCGVEACPVVYSGSKEDWEWMQTFIFIYICPFVFLVAGVLFLLNDFAFGKVSGVSHLKTLCLNTVDSFSQVLDHLVTNPPMWESSLNSATLVPLCLPSL